MEQQTNMTALEWLDRWFRDNYEATYEEGNKAFEQAKQMEKEQFENARPQIVSNCVIKEIPDEEIEKAIIDQDIVKQEGYCHCFLEGAQWYREQLKSK